MLDRRDPVGDQTFPRSSRLRRRSAYLCIYEQGKSAHGRYATVYCRPRPDGRITRLGMSVTRKLGGAVVRNRLRRRSREFFRRRRSQFRQGWDIVINYKLPAIEAPFHLLEQDLERTMTRLRLLEIVPCSPAAEPRADQSG